MSERVYSKCILGLANRIRRIYNVSTDNNGVQTRILHFVLANYSERDIYQKDIEEDLDTRSASISVLLKKMEGDEMIVRDTVFIEAILSVFRFSNHFIAVLRQNIFHY